MFPTNRIHPSVTCPIDRGGWHIPNDNWAIVSYVQSNPPSPDASPIPSLSYRSLVGAPILAARIVSHCFPHQFTPDEDVGSWGRGVCVYGAAFVSRKMFLFLRSWASGRICRCFSRDSWRSMGDRGVSSTVGAVVSSVMFTVGGLAVCVGSGCLYIERMSWFGFGPWICLGVGADYSYLTRPH